MDIVKSTDRYEKWLGRHMPIVKADLKAKHVAMAANEFAFLRATYYRFAQLAPAQPFAAAKVPHVLAVGDLHIENFGTWRDAEGRLVWGINDFDEAAPMPYTLDLVRLATSIDLAISSTPRFKASLKEACDRILTGYRGILEAFLAGGRQEVDPIVLAEVNPWLLKIAQQQIKNPKRFWDNLDANEKASRDAVPEELARYVVELMPRPAPAVSWRRRRAGLGSLGRPRFLALANWNGGRIARDAKYLAPSSWNWEGSGDSFSLTLYREILHRAVRSGDPYVRQFDNWIVRRLAPDCVRVPLDILPEDIECDLMEAMGRETANVHVGSADAVKDVLRDLKKRPDNWLFDAARVMAEFVHQDWDDWRKASKSRD